MRAADLRHRADDGFLSLPRLQVPGHDQHGRVSRDRMSGAKLGRRHVELRLGRVERVVNRNEVSVVQPVCLELSAHRIRYAHDGIEPLCPVPGGRRVIVVDAALVGHTWQARQAAASIQSWLCRTELLRCTMRAPLTPQKHRLRERLPQEAADEVHGLLNDKQQRIRAPDAM